MSYAVVLTDTAKQDLRDIAFWIAEKSKDVEMAKQFVDELRKECHKLATFPKSGSLPRDNILKSMGYRFIAYKNYLIFYLIDEEQKQVQVMAVFNAKRDYYQVMTTLCR